MTFLKQSTAATVAIGPFVDQTDGFTEEGGLTLSQADVRLSKNGGAFAQKNDATAATHMENGYYSCPLNATDTDTLGRLRLAVDEAGALPVWEDFMVLAANVFDALVAGTDKLEVDAVQLLGTAFATPTVAGVPEVDVTHWIGAAAATPTVAGVPEVDATHWRGEAVPATSVTGVPEVDVTHWIGTAVATPTVAGVPEVDVTHLGGAAQSATDLKDLADTGYDPVTHKVQGVVLVDTLTTYTGNTPQTGDSFARLGAPAGASVSADVAAVKAETASIQGDTNDLQTRVPAALVGGLMASSLTAAGLAADATSEVAGAVWDESRAGHVGSGSFGEGVRLMDDALDSSKLAASAAAEIADAVWDEARAGHVGAGTFGEGVIVNAIANGAITALSLAAAAANKLADHIWRRTYANLRASADGDAYTQRSGMGMLSIFSNKLSVTGGGATLQMTHEDDVTSAGTKAITTDAAALPIVALDP